MTTTPPPTERRRFPRQDVTHTITLLVEAVHDLQLVDISTSGVLLACSRLGRVDEQVQLRVLVGGEPFSASVRIVREVAGGPPHRFGTRCYGAAFVDMDETSRRTLQRFLASGPLPTLKS